MSRRAAARFPFLRFLENRGLVAFALYVAVLGLAVLVLSL